MPKLTRPNLMDAHTAQSTSDDAKVTQQQADIAVPELSPGEAHLPNEQDLMPAPGNMDPVGGFDYDLIKPELRDALREHHTVIRQKTTDSILIVGQELLRAKALLTKHYPRGTWSAWLASGLEMSESTARNIMAATEWVTKSPTVGVLSPSALYRGAMAPTEVQAQIVRRISAGESVPADEIATLIKVHKMTASPQSTGDEPDEDNTHTSSQALRSQRSDGERVSGDADELLTNSGDAAASLPSTPQQFGRPDEITTSTEDEETTTRSDATSRVEVALGEPGLAEQSKGELPSAATPAYDAAVELVADLRDLLADDDVEIRRLFELWRATTYDDLLCVLETSARPSRPNHGN